MILISKNPVIREQAFLLGITAEPFKDELAPSLKRTVHWKRWYNLYRFNHLYGFHNGIE